MGEKRGFERCGVRMGQKGKSVVSEYQQFAMASHYIIQNIVLFKRLATRMSSRQLQEAETNEIAGFIAKTFEILKNQEEFSKIIYWAPAGCEFIIKDVNKFQQIVLPRYFRHNKINSFIRQLNMYGFHKSRADHSKSVFSHPSFLRGRDDLLITIKRKIRERNDIRVIPVPETPVKKRQEPESAVTAVKDHPATGHQLHSARNMHLGDFVNNTSFNLIGTKEKLNSLMNLNFSLNRLPHGDMPDAQLEEESEDECVSIEHKMEGERLELTEPVRENHNSLRFMNPSCFFDSMQKNNDL